MPESPLDRLERIANGFMQAKILLAGAELRFFDRLRAPGTTAGELARASGSSERGTEILLDALTAMGILIKEGAAYRNDPDFEPWLLEDAPSHYVALLRHRNHVLKNWAFVEDKLRGRPPGALRSPRAIVEEREANENFIRAMYAASHGRAPAIVDRIDLTGVRTLADLGGGPGHYLAEFARRSPTIEPFLLDLPLTLAVARKILEPALRDRTRFIAWDFYEEKAPAGLPLFDLVFVSQVIHSESPGRNCELFRTLHGMITPGGRMIVHENVVDPGRTSPLPAALFAVNMLAGTEGGRTYTEEEIVSWGSQAGFRGAGGGRVDERSYLVHLERPR